MTTTQIKQNVKNGNAFNPPVTKAYFWPSFFLSFVLIFGGWAISTFIPDFIFKNNFFGNNNASFFAIFNLNFIINGDSFQKAFAILYWIFLALALIITQFLLFLTLRFTFAVMVAPKWWSVYNKYSTEIVNSCEKININAKVAMVVCTCNDIVPNTILQTSRQTYKNMDVWISDDSNKPDMIAQIDKFASQYGFHVLHRDSSHKKLHPTKIGNLFFFLDKFGDKYDYIFVNDSSTITTTTFVENGLCFFYSPLYSHDKDAAVVSFGMFYGNKNLLSWLYSAGMQFGDGITNVLQFYGHPMLLHGWGALYKTPVLKSIPLEAIECPSDDTASGFWLVNKKYNSYMNPFDFSGKMCPQNMEGYKNQQLKWSGGDVFMYRTHLSLSDFHNKKVNLFTYIVQSSATILIPVLMFISIILNISICCLNFFYLNLSSILFLIIFVLFNLIFFIIVLLFNKNAIKFLFMLLFNGLCGGAIIYKKAFHIIKCRITKKWSSGAVTVKTTQRLTVKQKCRMSLFDFFIFMLILAISITLTCLTANHIINLNYFIIWFNIFTVFSGPSILYVALIWIGEIKTKEGWSKDLVEYNYWINNFWYPYVSSSSIWKKQHKI